MILIRCLMVSCMVGMPMANAAFEFDVFLSHNSKDKPVVEQIARILRDGYELHVWLDKWNLVPGEGWQEALERGLNKSRSVAVFLGEAGFGNWENEEWRVAVDSRVAKAKTRVIPVVLPGAPDPSKMSAFLRRYAWVDLRTGYDAKEKLYFLYCGIKGSPPGDKATTLEIPDEILAVGQKRLTSNTGGIQGKTNLDRSQSVASKKTAASLRAITSAKESTFSALITSISSEHFDEMKNQISQLEGHMRAYIIWNERVTTCEEAKSKLVDGTNINWANIAPGSNTWIRYWSQVKNLLKQAMMGEIPDSLMSDEIRKHAGDFRAELDQALGAVESVTNESIHHVLGKAQSHIEDASAAFHPVLNDFKTRALAELTQIQTQIKAIIDSNEASHIVSGQSVTSRERPRNLQPTRQPKETAIETRKTGKPL